VTVKNSTIPNCTAGLPASLKWFLYRVVFVTISITYYTLRHLRRYGTSHVRSGVVVSSRPIKCRCGIPLPSVHFKPDIDRRFMETIRKQIQLGGTLLQFLPFNFSFLPSPPPLLATGSCVPFTWESGVLPGKNEIDIAVGEC